MVFGFGSVLAAWTVVAFDAVFAAFGAFSDAFLATFSAALGAFFATFFDVVFAAFGAFFATFFEVVFPTFGAFFGDFFGGFFGDFFAARGETGAFLPFFVDVFVFPEAFLPLAGFAFENLAGFPARRGWGPAMHAGLNERGEIRQEV